MPGKVFEDREKSSELRAKAMNEILAVLEDKKDIVKKFGEYKKQMLLKLASNILPRLTVVEGNPDGSPITYKIIVYGENDPASAIPIEKPSESEKVE